MSWPHISEEFLELREDPFSPYVLIETESKMPSSISMAGAAGNSMKYIEVRPGTNLEKVQQVVRDHFAKNQGNCILYGRITGFLYVESPSEAVRLDTSGNVIRSGTGKFWPRSIHRSI